jgi:hypothetical protein
MQKTTKKNFLKARKVVSTYLKEFTIYCVGMVNLLGEDTKVPRENH